MCLRRAAYSGFPCFGETMTTAGLTLAIGGGGGDGGGGNPSAAYVGSIFTGPISFFPAA
jgi:hypothetical protein